MKNRRDFITHAKAYVQLMHEQRQIRGLPNFDTWITTRFMPAFRRTNLSYPFLHLQGKNSQCEAKTRALLVACCRGDLINADFISQLVLDRATQ
jgi:hypothetical protein